jgi:hypothetical protein
MANLSKTRTAVSSSTMDYILDAVSSTQWMTTQDVVNMAHHWSYGTVTRTLHKLADSGEITRAIDIQCIGYLWIKKG